MIKQGHMAALTDMLEDNGIEYVIDSKISGEPTDVMICEITTLEEYGINKDEFLGFADKMAQDAIDSGSPSNTRRNITKENIINIYNQLLE